MNAAAEIRGTRDHPVWRALADPTRRQILDRLRAGPQTTGELGRAFPISRFGVMKHLQVLEQAGLLRIERKGRERWNHLNPVPVQQIYRRWIRPFEAPVADRLLRLRQTVERSQTATEAMTDTDQFRAHTVELEVQIDAEPARVWQSLTEQTTEWWSKDFCVGKAHGFHIEARLGGRMYEDWGDGEGLIWAQVTGLRSPELLQLSGELTKDFGGPARTMTAFKLRAEGEGTVVSLSETVFGAVGHKIAQSLREGWTMILADGLKAYVEQN